LVDGFSYWLIDDFMADYAPAPLAAAWKKHFDDTPGSGNLVGTAWMHHCDQYGKEWRIHRALQPSGERVLPSWVTDEWLRASIERKMRLAEIKRNGWPDMRWPPDPAVIDYMLEERSFGGVYQALCPILDLPHQTRDHVRLPADRLTSLKRVPHEAAELPLAGTGWNVDTPDAALVVTKFPYRQINILKVS
jgi:hypothetical protein